MTTYTIKEAFNTLQGEGVRSGQRSVFLRLSGCNMWDGKADNRFRGKGACAQWCDTMFFGGEKMTKFEIEDRLEVLWPDEGTGERWVVITGGEPTLQLDVDLVTMLHDQGWKIALETNGTNDTAAARSCDHITISPKRSSLEVVLPVCHELKVVLPGALRLVEAWTDEDLMDLARKYPDAEKFVQPQDAIDGRYVGVTHLHSIQPNASGTSNTVIHAALAEEYRINLKRCIDFVMAHPSWRMSLQTHKLASLP